jgi:Aspartyl protease
LIAKVHWKLDLSTRSHSEASTTGRSVRAILDGSRAMPAVPRNVIRRRTQRVRQLLLLIIILLTPLPNRARPASLRLPFRSVQAMILVEVKVNGNPATFVLDTGASRTIISSKTYSTAQVTLPRWPHSPNSAGLIGYSQRRSADLSIGEHVWFGQSVLVMDLEELQGMLKLDFDGLLGEDILRQFRSVRIDYHTHIIELEE